MTAQVIAVSRQVGTGGEQIALQVASELGLRYIDHQVIQAAADAAGVSPETVEDSEKAPSLLDRVLASLAFSGDPVGTWNEPGSVSSSPLITSSAYRTLIEGVVQQLADEGNCLILGHAAHIVLRARTDTLRVLVTGDEESRVRRLLEAGIAPEKEARATVERTDKERLDYFHRFYGSSWLAPEDYDLCINTSRISDGDGRRIDCCRSRRARGCRAVDTARSPRRHGPRSPWGVCRARRCECTCVPGWMRSGDEAA